MSFSPSAVRGLATQSNAWSVADIRLLRELAGKNVPLDAIAATLRRSPSAIKNKANMHGISLRRVASDSQQEAGNDA